MSGNKRLIMADQEIMNAENIKSLPVVKRISIRELVVYDVSANELESLAADPSDQMPLTFGIFLMTVGLSYLSVLLTISIESIRVFSIFVVIAIVGLAGGAFFICIGIRAWRKSRRIKSELVRTIKERL